MLSYYSNIVNKKEDRFIYPLSHYLQYKIVKEKQVEFLKSETQMHLAE